MTARWATGQTITTQKVAATTHLAARTIGTTLNVTITTTAHMAARTTTKIAKTTARTITKTHTQQEQQ